MGNKTFLQISDLHFGIDNESTNAARNALVDSALCQAVLNHYHFDGLIITGDLIHGKTNDVDNAYEKAGAYIDRIQRSLDIKRNKIYIVPGNHDVDLKDDQRSEAVIKLRDTYNPRNGSILPEVKCHLKTRKQFSQLYTRITKKIYNGDHSLYERRDGITFLCLDSSLASLRSNDDYKKIILGVRQISNKLEKRKNKDARMIVAVHHSLDWLMDSERAQLIRLFNDNGVVLLCCGHIHEEIVYDIKTRILPEDGFRVSIAPSLVDELSQNPRIGFSIISIGDSKNEISIESFAWSFNDQRYIGLYNTLGTSYTIRDDTLINRMNPRINSFELYRIRTNRMLSIRDLHKITGIKTERIEEYERIDSNKLQESLLLYPKVYDHSDIVKLSYALSLNKYDSLLANVEYYSKNERIIKQYAKAKGISKMPIKSGTTKAVIFDFDGTLTKSAFLKTSWERMWISCGYKESDCRKLHERFFLGEFSHQEWCDITANKFIAHNFARRNIKEIAKQTELLEGTHEVLKQMHDLGVGLYIVSGSVDVLIKEVLGTECASWFTEIKANQMHFDRKGFLTGITGTEYDFDGKASFVKQVIDDNKYTIGEVVYFGNSFNDESVARTGIKTVCINPKETNAQDKERWTYRETGVDSMRVFLNYI